MKIFGLVLLGILGVIVLALLAFLLIPARVRVKYDGALRGLWVGAGPVTLRLLPKKEKKAKKSKPTPKAKTSALSTKEKTTPPAPAAPPASEAEKPSVKAKAPTKAKKIDLSAGKLWEYMPLAKKALARMAGAIKISRLRLHLVVGGQDPGKAALNYGRICAAVAAFIPLLEKSINWHDADVLIEVDFNGQGKIDADVKVSVRPAVVLGAAIGLLLGVLKAGRAPKEKEVSKEEQIPA